MSVLGSSAVLCAAPTDETSTSTVTTGTQPRPCAAAPQALLPAPVHLHVEGLLPAAAVISEAVPRFSFIHAAHDPRQQRRQRQRQQPPAPQPFGVVQRTYRITVSRAWAFPANTTHMPKTGLGKRDKSALAVAGSVLWWDSGDVASDSCSEIRYGGARTLLPFTQYRWTVEWSSSRGNRSAQAAALFETGPMVPSDWQDAGWLHTPAPAPSAGGHPRPRTTPVPLAKEHQGHLRPTVDALSAGSARHAAAGPRHVPGPDQRGSTAGGGASATGGDPPAPTLADPPTRGRAHGLVHADGAPTALSAPVLADTSALFRLEFTLASRNNVQFARLYVHTCLAAALVPPTCSLCAPNVNRWSFARTKTH